LNAFISLPTRTEKAKPIWVHYFIYPGSPYTFLTAETLKALDINSTSNELMVFINGRSSIVRPST